MSSLTYWYNIDKDETKDVAKLFIRVRVPYYMILAAANLMY